GRRNVVISMTITYRFTIDGINTNNGGTGGIVMNGPGALRLSGGTTSGSGANTFSGGIVVNSGTLRLRGTGAAGTGPGGTGNALVTLQGAGTVLETAVSNSVTYAVDVL